MFANLDPVSCVRVKNDRRKQLPNTPMIILLPSEQNKPSLKVKPQIEPNFGIL